MPFLKIYQKFIASTVLACFLASFFTFPPEARASSAPASLPIEVTPTGKDFSSSFVPLGIPRELASIEEVFIPNSQKGTATPLIHIQSVHAHPETQKKIYALLKFLDEKYGIGSMFIEGAGEELNPEYFRFFDENRLNIRVAEKLVEKGELTGAELFLIESNKKIPAYGIEEPSLYRENLTSFQTVMTERPMTARFTQETHGLLDRLETLLLTPDARKLLRSNEAFDAGQMELLSYANELNRRAQANLGIDLLSYKNQFNWPQMIRLLRLLEVETSLDPEKIQSERERLVGFLRQIDIDPLLINSFQNLAFSPFQSGMVYDPGFRQNDLPRYLAERLVAATREKGFSFEAYPYFTRYLQAAILQSELEAKRLFEEMERLFESLMRSVSQKEEEIVLTGLVQKDRLFERLFDLELTPKDYAKLQTVNQETRPLVKFMLDLESLETKTSAGPRKLVPDNIETLESVYGQAVRFYQLAKEREEKMAQKILEKISQENAPDKAPLTILITGGFHTEGLSRTFRNKQVPYTIVSPRITEKVSAEAYVSMLLGEKKTAFDTQHLEPAINSQSSDMLIKQGGPEMAWNRTRKIVLQVVDVGQENSMPLGNLISQTGRSLFFRDRGLAAKQENGYLEISSHNRRVRFPIANRVTVTETQVALPSLVSEGAPRPLSPSLSETPQSPARSEARVSPELIEARKGLIVLERDFGAAFKKDPRYQVSRAALFDAKNILKRPEPDKKALEEVLRQILLVQSSLHKNDLKERVLYDAVVQIRRQIVSLNSDLLIQDTQDFLSEATRILASLAGLSENEIKEGVTPTSPRMVMLAKMRDYYEWRESLFARTLPKIAAVWKSFMAGDFLGARKIISEMDFPIGMPEEDRQRLYASIDDIDQRLAALAKQQPAARSEARNLSRRSFVTTATTMGLAAMLGLPADAAAQEKKSPSLASSLADFNSFQSAVMAQLRARKSKPLAEWERIGSAVYEFTLHYRSRFEKYSAESQWAFFVRLYRFILRKRSEKSKMVVLGPNQTALLLLNSGLDQERFKKRVAVFGGQVEIFKVDERRGKTNVQVKQAFLKRIGELVKAGKPTTIMAVTHGNLEAIGLAGNRLFFDGQITYGELARTLVRSASEQDQHDRVDLSKLVWMCDACESGNFTENMAGAISQLARQKELQLVSQPTLVAAGSRGQMTWGYDAGSVFWDSLAEVAIRRGLDGPKKDRNKKTPLMLGDILGAVDRHMYGQGRTPIWSKNSDILGFKVIDPERVQDPIIWIPLTDKDIQELHDELKIPKDDLLPFLQIGQNNLPSSTQLASARAEAREGTREIPEALKRAISDLGLWPEVEGFFQLPIDEFARKVGEKVRIDFIDLYSSKSLIDAKNKALKILGRVDLPGIDKNITVQDLGDTEIYALANHLDNLITDGLTELASSLPAEGRNELKPEQRRRFSFSLRKLFLFMTIFSVILGGIAFYEHNFVWRNRELPIKEQIRRMDKEIEARGAVGKIFPKSQFARDITDVGQSRAISASYYYEKLAGEDARNHPEFRIGEKDAVTAQHYRLLNREHAVLVTLPDGREIIYLVDEDKGNVTLTLLKGPDETTDKLITKFRSLLGESKDPEVQLLAVIMLGEIAHDSKGTNTLSALSDLLEATMKSDKSTKVRSRAAIAIGQLGRDAKNVVPSLVQTLKNKNENSVVRGDAAEALGRIITREISLKDEARLMAIKALREIAQESIKNDYNEREDAFRYLSRGVSMALLQIMGGKEATKLYEEIREKEGKTKASARSEARGIQDLAGKVKAWLQTKKWYQEWERRSYDKRLEQVQTLLKSVNAYAGFKPLNDEVELDKLLNDLDYYLDSSYSILFYLPDERLTPAQKERKQALKEKYDSFRDLINARIKELDRLIPKPTRRNIGRSEIREMIFQFLQTYSPELFFYGIPVFGAVMMVLHSIYSQVMGGWHLAELRQIERKIQEDPRWPHLFKLLRIEELGRKYRGAVRTTIRDDVRQAANNAFNAYLDSIKVSPPVVDFMKLWFISRLSSKNPLRPFAEAAVYDLTTEPAKGPIFQAYARHLYKKWQSRAPRSEVRNLDEEAREKLGVMLQKFERGELNQFLLSTFGKIKTASALPYNSKLATVRSIQNESQRQGFDPIFAIYLIQLRLWNEGAAQRKLDPSVSLVRWTPPIWINRELAGPGRNVTSEGEAMYEIAQETFSYRALAFEYRVEKWQQLPSDDRTQAQQPSLGREFRELRTENPARLATLIDMEKFEALFPTRSETRPVPEESFEIKVRRYIRERRVVELRGLLDQIPETNRMRRKDAEFVLTELLKLPKDDLVFRTAYGSVFNKIIEILGWDYIRQKGWINDLPAAVAKEAQLAENGGVYGNVWKLFQSNPIATRDRIVEEVHRLIRKWSRDQDATYLLQIANAFAARLHLITNFSEKDLKAVLLLDELSDLLTEPAFVERVASLPKNSILRQFLAAAYPNVYSNRSEVREIPLALKNAADLTNLPVQNRFGADSTVIESGNLPAGLGPRLGVPAAGFGTPLILPEVAAFFQSLPQPNPQVALDAARHIFIRDGKSDPILNVLIAENPTLHAVFLQVLEQAVEEGLTSADKVDAVVREVFSTRSREGALLREQSERPGAHVLILDHVPDQEELWAILIPALVNSNLFIEILLTPDANAGSRELSQMKTQIAQFLPDAQKRVTVVPSRAGEFDNALSEMGSRLYQRMAGEMSLPKQNVFIKEHLVVSVSENLWTDSFEQKIGKEIQTILYAFGPKDGQYRAYLGGEALLASKLAQNVLSRDQKRPLTRLPSGRYRVEGKDLAQFVASIQAAITGFERILSAA